MKKMRPIVQFKRAQRIDILAMEFAKGDYTIGDEFGSDIFTSKNYSEEEKKYILRSSMTKEEMDLFDKHYEEYMNETE